MGALTGTRNFTRAEYERSGIAAARGLPNVVPPHLEEAAQHVLERLQVLRDRLGVPLHVTSGYRSPLVNQLSGGAVKSQHLKAEAVDVWSPRVSRGEMLMAVSGLLADGGWSVDQCISYEHGGEIKRRMLHLSFRLDGNDRGDILHSPAPGVYERATLPR